MMSTAALSALLALLFSSTVLCQPGPAPYAPGSGAWFGVTYDFTTMNVQDYINQAGLQPAVWNVFTTLPVDDNSTKILNLALPQLAELKALVFLTIEPTYGLSRITYAEINKLAFYIKQAQLAGASFMVSFGHEMNGNWYEWGQQPAAYVDAFQKVARTLNTATCGVAMVWAPNGAKGYPWRDAQGNSLLGSPPGSPDWALMDTNGDGQVTELDDPLLPYWPGDDNVTWVGMAAYSWGGGSAPFTKNALPADQQFTTMIDNYGSAATSLYGRFSADGVHNKPMIITETSALYIPANGVGNTNYEIKSAWWQQAYNAQKDLPNALSLAEHYPQIKMIFWFDEIKPEDSAGGNIVDWRFSADAQIKQAFGEFVASQTKPDGSHYWGDLIAFRESGLATGCPAGP